MTPDPTLAPWSLFGRRHAVVPGGARPDLVAALRSDARRSRSGAVTAGRQVAITSLARPEVRRAADLLSGLATACHLGGPFQPTEASYHRLRPEHRDPPRRENRYYAECVALVVLCGVGELGVHDERVRDRIVGGGPVRAGDVVLLRGWSPLGFADPRPHYRIEASGGPMTVFRARHNLASGDRPSAWLDGLTSREVREATVRAALSGWPAGAVG